MAGAIYLLYQGYKKIMSIVNKDKKEDKKASSNDDTEGTLNKLFNLSKTMGTNTIPTGEINVKVEANNNSKAEASVVKQSGLKLGVQQ